MSLSGFVVLLLMFDRVDADVPKVAALEPADLIITKAKIFTVDEALPEA